MAAYCKELHIGVLTRASAHHATKPYVSFGMAKYLLSQTRMNEGGCASVVNATLLEVFSINPAAVRCRMKLSSEFCPFLRISINEDVICITQIK